MPELQEVWLVRSAPVIITNHHSTGEQAIYSFAPANLRVVGVHIASRID